MQRLARLGAATILIDLSIGTMAVKKSDPSNLTDISQKDDLSAIDAVLASNVNTDLQKPSEKIPLYNDTPKELLNDDKSDSIDIIDNDKIAESYNFVDATEIPITVLGANKNHLIQLVQVTKPISPPKRHEPEPFIVMMGELEELMTIAATNGFHTFSKVSDDDEVDTVANDDDTIEFKYPSYQEDEYTQSSRHFSNGANYIDTTKKMLNKKRIQQSKDDDDAAENVIVESETTKHNTEVEPKTKIDFGSNIANKIQDSAEGLELAKTKAGTALKDRFETFMSFVDLDLDYEINPSAAKNSKYHFAKENASPEVHLMKDRTLDNEVPKLITKVKSVYENNDENGEGAHKAMIQFLQIMQKIESNADLESASFEHLMNRHKELAPPVFLSNKFETRPFPQKPGISFLQSAEIKENIENQPVTEGLNVIDPADIESLMTVYQQRLNYIPVATKFVNPKTLDLKSKAEESITGEEQDSIKSTQTDSTELHKAKEHDSEKCIEDESGKCKKNKKNKSKTTTPCDGTHNCQGSENDRKATEELQNDINLKKEKVDELQKELDNTKDTKKKHLIERQLENEKDELDILKSQAQVASEHEMVLEHGTKEGTTKKTSSAEENASSSNTQNQTSTDSERKEPLVGDKSEHPDGLEPTKTDGELETENAANLKDLEKELGSSKNKKKRSRLQRLIDKVKSKFANKNKKANQGEDNKNPDDEEPHKKLDKKHDKQAELRHEKEKRGSKNLKNEKYGDVGNVNKKKQSEHKSSKAEEESEHETEVDNKDDDQSEHDILKKQHKSVAKKKAVDGTSHSNKIRHKQPKAIQKHDSSKTMGNHAHEEEDEEEQQQEESDEGMDVDDEGDHEGIMVPKTRPKKNPKQIDLPKDKSIKTHFPSSVQKSNHPNKSAASINCSGSNLTEVDELACKDREIIKKVPFHTGRAANTSRISDIEAVSFWNTVVILETLEKLDKFAGDLTEKEKLELLGFTGDVHRTKIVQGLSKTHISADDFNSLAEFEKQRMTEMNDYRKLIAPSEDVLLERRGIQMREYAREEELLEEEKSLEAKHQMEEKIQKHSQSAIDYEAQKSQLTETQSIGRPGDMTSTTPATSKSGENIKVISENDQPSTSEKPTDKPKEENTPDTMTKVIDSLKHFFGSDSSSTQSISPQKDEKQIDAPVRGQKQKHHNFEDESFNSKVHFLETDESGSYSENFIPLKLKRF